MGGCLLASANAQVLNEIVVNPNGGDDNCEYIEIRGGAGLALTDHYFVSLEGDATSNEGSADFLVDLTASQLGSNGLLVYTSRSLPGSRIQLLTQTLMSTGVAAKNDLHQLFNYAR